MGQLAALGALAMTAWPGLPHAFLRDGLLLACATEAVGFGAGAALALRGTRPHREHVVRWGLSLVLWALSVRHGALVVAPGALDAPELWIGAVVVWCVGAGVLTRQGGVGDGRWWPWLVAVVATGAVNTVWMGMRRFALSELGLSP